MNRPDGRNAFAFLGIFNHLHIGKEELSLAFEEIIRNSGAATAVFGSDRMGFSKRSTGSSGDSVVRAGTRLMDAFWIAVTLWAVDRLYIDGWADHYTLAVACAIGLFMLFAESIDLYRSWHGASLIGDLLRMVAAWILVVLGLALIAYVTGSGGEYTRAVILTWFVATPFVLTAAHAGLHMLLAIIRRHGFNTRRVAIVGARELGANLAQTILRTPSMGLMPVGFYDDRKLAGSRRVSGELAGDLDDLVEAARKGDVDLIYITLPMFAEARIKRLINKLSDSTVSVYLVPDVFMYELLHSKWGNIGDLPVISIFDTPFYGVDGWLKRALDVVAGSIILLIIAVPMLLIALEIKRTSAGSVFFKQRRYGMNGHMIDVWKFRTMLVSEDGSEVTQAKKNDPRITPFGAFLRRTSLDELPQFINVLQGTMSIVGPRPHAVAHNEQYRKLISGYMLRHKVKPGITGLAQINGWRGETDAIEKMQKRVEHDLGYISNWSLGLDIKIILLTVFRGFSSKNAY